MSKKFRALLVALVSAGSLAMGTTIIVAPAAAGGVLQTAHGGDNVTGSQAVHFLDSVQKPRRLGTVTQAVDFHWWGVDHNFGPVGTNRILAALNVGSGLSTLVAILCAGTVVGVPCAFAYGVAAALMTIGGGLIGWCSRNGNGFRVVKPLSVCRTARGGDVKPRLGVPLIVGGMVLTALFYQESWPLWPTSLFMGVGLLAMTVVMVRRKRAVRED